MITYDKLNFFNVSNTGDGDSSVLKRLRIAKPYGSDIMIKKVECTNHLLRNYINKLRDIANKRKNSNGDRIPGCFRILLQNNLLRLRYAVTEAIRFRKHETGIISYEEKLARLKADVINGPNHVFGDHDNCSQYFCQRQKKGKIKLFFFLYTLFRLLKCSRSVDKKIRQGKKSLKFNTVISNMLNIPD